MSSALNRFDCKFMNLNTNSTRENEIYLKALQTSMTAFIGNGSLNFPKITAIKMTLRTTMVMAKIRRLNSI